MTTSSRFWLVTCIVLAISSCSAFGQADVGAPSVASTTCRPGAANDLMSISRADPTVGARSIDGDSNSVLTALFGGSGLAATCGDSLADVGTSSTSATQGSAVGTLLRFVANGLTVE